MSGRTISSEEQKQHVLKLSDLELKATTAEPLAPVAFATVVRELLQNSRQGTVGCKTRAMVTGSNKKPWKQKGTGRARAGARTSPLWRGGGIIFGPQARVRKLKTSKGLKRAVARELLNTMLTEERLLLLNWALEGTTPKTKQAFLALRENNLHTVPVNVFLSMDDALTVASFVNIPSVRIIYFDAPNAYALADAQYWVVLKKDMDAFKTMVDRWK